MLAALLMLAAQTGEPIAQRTTPVGTLAACQAKTLYEAANCLRTNLSESDRIALVASDGPSTIRADIDRFVQFEFRLYQPDSAVGNWLRERGIGSRLVQSAVIIDEYLAQQRGQSQNLKLIAKAAEGVPDGTAPTAEEFSASASKAAASTKISKEECAKITKLPAEQLGECVMEGDRIKVMRIEKARAN